MKTYEYHVWVPGKGHVCITSKRELTMAEARCIAGGALG